MLELITVNPPSQQVDACVIWFHGLGADGNDLVGCIPELALPKEHSVRMVFPHAPVKSITLHGGMKTRAWFDVAGIETFMTAKEPDQEIAAAATMVTELVEGQINLGIERKRIILAGFSQGAATVLAHYLTTPKGCGGAISLAGWLPFAAPPAGIPMPLFVSHGMQDPVVPYTAFKRIKSFMEKHHVLLEDMTEQTQHSLTKNQLSRCGSFITRILAQPSDAATHILYQQGTEPAGSHQLVHEKRTGVYYCAGCKAPLFLSESKFDSGTGWPSFTQEIAGALTFHQDTSFGMVRTEYGCTNCGGHHGHVFDDGPEPTGKRYCNNGSSLSFCARPPFPPPHD